MTLFSTILSKWKPISAFMRVGKIKEQALDWTNEVTQRGGIYSSPIVPKDLRNTHGRSILTRSGKLVAGVTLFRDWNKGEDAGINPLILALIFAAMISYNVFHSVFSAAGPGGFMDIGLGAFIFVVIYLLTMSPTFFDIILIGGMLTAIFGAMSFAGNTLFGSILTYATPAVVLWTMNKLKDNRRAKLLRFQASQHMDTMGESHVEHNETENPLVAQINMAIKDQSPILTVGVATGVFQKNGAMTAPEPGTEFGLSVDDLSRHMFVFGKSGAGKSFFARWIAYLNFTAARNVGKKLGMLVLDGKGDLAWELEPLLDKIVNPSTVKHLNVIAGVSPSKWRKIIEDMNGAGKVQGDNKIFSVLAGDLVYQTAVVHDAFIKMNVEGIKFNLSTRYNLMAKLIEKGQFDKDGNFVSHPVVDILTQHDDYENNLSLKDAVNFIVACQSEDRQKLTQSVLAQAQSWLSGFFQNAEMRQWAESETSDFDIAQVAFGLRVGVALAPERFGVAGTIVTQILKARIFNIVANRESNWQDRNPNETSIMLVIDECQDLVNDDDVDNAPKARSRGLIMFYLTQSITHLHEKFGVKDKSYKLLLSFSSVGSFLTDDHETNEYMQRILGSVRYVSSRIATGAPIDFKHTTAVFLRSPEFDSNHPEAGNIKRSGGQSIIHSANEVLGIKYQGGIGAKFVRKTDAEFNEFATYSTDENNPVRPLLADDDLNRLQVPQHAIFRLMRAGMPRADIIKVKGISTKDLATRIKVGA
jgi:hypothetical protein